MTNGRLRPSFGLYFATALPFLLAAYLPSMRGEFLMSDFRAVVNNLQLTSLHGLLSIWLLPPNPEYLPMDQYQPLTYTLWWIERHLWGLDPRFYQLVSVVLHAFNSLLVWRLLARIGVRGALVAAAIFAVHPVHVESVAWIYEQKNPVSGAFFFLTLHAYLNYENGRRRSWYVAALAFFAAALLSKASTVVLPVVILLHLWFRREPWTWRTLAPTVPFFALGALMASVTIWYETSVTAATGDLYAAGVLERVARAGWVTGFHAGKVLVPTGLAFLYPRWSTDTSDWVAYVPDLSILVVLAVLWLRREEWGRPGLLGLGWYLVLLFPVMGFFDIYYHQFSLLADHFQYLASIGLIALVGHVGVVGLEKTGVVAIGANAVRHRGTALIAGLLVVGFFWTLAWQRSHVFANEGLLFRDAAEKYPTSWLAFQKSAEFSLKRVAEGIEDPGSALQQAIADLKHAAKIRPDHPQVQDSLGVAYFKSGRFEEARHHLEMAIALDPANPDYHWNLALLYDELKETGLAVAEYKTVVAAVPQSPDMRFRLAGALVRAKRFHEGIGTLDTTIEHAASLAADDPRMAEVLRQARQLRKQVRARVESRASGPAPAMRSGQTWNVLLLTVDTLRPDYMSLNGYDVPTSPALDSLLSEGIYFEQALTPIPRTTPALASLLTGAYPHVTGVRSLPSPLPDQMMTLAEAFRADGYQTLAVVTNMLLATVRGLDAGFDTYDAAVDLRDARHTTNIALSHIEASEPDKPLFAWVHYIDPHVPYHPTPNIAESFDPGYDGRFGLRFGRQPGPSDPLHLFREFPEGLSKSQVTHRNPLTDEENAHIQRLYAGDIKMVDNEIGRLVAAVRARFPRTVIVFTADHGESLGEHGFYFDHGDYAYNASSRVPLAFVLPREHPWYGTGRRGGWVSLVDVAPTLFEVVGREPPPEMAVLFEGRSLAPSLRGEPLPHAPVFIESGTSFFPELVHRRQRNDVEGRFRAVTLGDWKLIWTPFLPDSEAWELYDLGADPDETRNLYRSDHPQLARLKPHLDAWLAVTSLAAAPAPPLTHEDREALRKLGYIE
jgi:arylsulfatase A-like enzyme